MDIQQLSFKPKYIKKGCINFDLIKPQNGVDIFYYTCPICLNFIFDIRECNICHQYIGGECLLNWLNEGNTTCPISGCEEFTENKNFTRIKMKDYLNINISCPYSYCNECLNVLTYFSHIEVCDFKLYQCLGKECSYEGDIYEIDEHVKCNCEHLSINCKECGAEVKVSEYSEHLKLCDIPEICNRCSQIFPKNKIKNHKCCFSITSQNFTCEVCLQTLTKENYYSHETNSNECKSFIINKAINEYKQQVKINIFGLFEKEIKAIY